MSGCASESASKAELTQLRAEVRSLDAAQARLAGRLDQIEGASAMQRAKPAPRGEPMTPELTVVKHKPKTDPAPRLDTQVDVREPAPLFVRELPAPAERQDVDPVPSTDPAVADAEYERGVAALKTGNVEGGVTRLLAFAQQYPAHGKADNALYFAGLGQMGLQDYAAAAGTFDRLIEEHPAGDAVQDGMLRLAECRVRLNQASDAKALYTRVVLNYPGTAAASLAEARLAAMH
jgi:tol-pal system protein YbgF